MPLIIKLMDAFSPYSPIFINANHIQSIYDHPHGTRIMFAKDSHFTVKESPEKVVQLILESVAAFSSQEPPPSSMWHIPIPRPSEGCVCGIRPHFDDDESDSLP